MELPFSQKIRRWYPRLTSDHDSGLLRYNPCLSQDSILICRQGEEYRSFSLFEPLYLFAKEILQHSPSNRTFYEVILGDRYQKPYFDIDIDTLLPKDDIEKLFFSIKNSLFNQDSRISEKDVIIFSSHGTNKMSFHVVIDHWCFPDVESNRFFCNKVIEGIPSTLPTKKYIDSAVYKSIQQFRTFGSTKYGQDRFKKLSDIQCHNLNFGIIPTSSLGLDDNKVTENSPSNLKRSEFVRILFSSLITNTMSCRVLGYEIIPKKLWDASAFPDLTIEETELIYKLPFIQDQTFSVVDVKNRLVALKRHSPSYCDLCERKHENENPFLTLSPCGRFIYFNCRRSKGRLTYNLAEYTIHNRQSDEVDDSNAYSGKNFLKKFLGRK